ncbi:DsrE/DsrF/DrsH-like family protein [Prosthecobacter sp.]|uniref:DsrE/DsrF/DrsH-like family protein n=1 Tax=Prosthecobacter sp. TaxID=1965333 RepID=UPI0024870B3A|nr:DsrE/DsrF/DrsH-like family protein [Prosthecobacter sp.]MDI1312610.1 DsrE/DsrF/DrsH-like family protein [Prosthecobacter sp.]
MSTPDDKQPVKKISIIVSKGSLDGIYPALIMANGARMEGIEASLFFTFFGLNALANKTLDHLKVSTVGNAALNMAMPMLGLPITMPFPTVVGAIPGVSAFATHLMNKEMEKLDIPPVREFLELISDSGGKIFACKLAMDMFKLKKEDLMDRVDAVLTVGQFYEESAGAGTHILFT